MMDIVVNSVLGLFDGIDFQRTLEQIQAALRSPGEHRAVAVMMVVIVAIAVVLLILFLLMLATPSRKKVVRTRTYVSREAAQESVPPEAERPAPKPPGRFFLALTGTAAVSILIALAFVGLYAVTSTDAYCAQTCHAGSAATPEASEPRHASCTGCHEARLVWGAPVNSVSRLEMVWNAGRGLQVGAVGEPVDSSTCVRCHSDVLEESVLSESGVAMSHKEVVAGAIPCTECHARSGHEASSGSISMSDCVGCHDSQTASAECSSCHQKDPVAAGFADQGAGLIRGGGDFQYPAVRAANRDCGACHDLVAYCDGCHGIRMPHSEEFKEGGHARAAAFELKLQCGDCHDPVDCGRCHTSFNATDGSSTHGGDWRSGHTTAGWDAGCGCHSGRSPRDYPICYRCHNQDHSLKKIEP